MRRWEEVAYALGRVNRHRQIYASDETVTRRIEQKAQIRDLLEALSAVNELGDTFTLAELCEHSVSNPANRRAELMARIAGQEQLAKQLGYGADFLTITCPSRMHASLSRPGDANPNYDGTLPDGAQAYLSGVWARIRAKAKRDALPMFGMRVAEPQHDGTPHWHLLVFFPPDDRKRLRGLFSHYALETDGNEPVAHNRRFVAEEIDPLKGTAIGYLAKYISKNVDGYGLDFDEQGLAIGKSVVRVDAWASAWRIRQFQEFGTAPVSAYRELRRVRTEVPESRSIEACRVAADTGDWAAYVAAQGGPGVRRRDQRVRVAKVWSDELGRYGEPRGDTVIGVSSEDVTVQTRVHTWRIELSIDAQGAPRLSTGKSDVVRDSGRTPAGRSPAGVGPLSPRPTGVPVSSAGCLAHD